MAQEAGPKTESPRILESLSDCFYSVDADWTILAVNHATEQAWNRKREDLVGQNLWHIFPSYRFITGGQELQRVMRERVATAFDTDSPFLQTTVRTAVYPAPDGGLEVHFRDIPAQRQLLSEPGLACSPHTTATGAEGVSFWQWDVERDRVSILYHFQGLPSDFVEGPLVESLRGIHPDDVESVERAMRAAARQGGRYACEYRRMLPGGDMRWYCSQGEAAEDMDGRIRRLAGVNYDITGRKAAQDEAERQAAFEFAILKLARNFIRMPADELDRGIMEAIAMVGEYCDFEAAAVWLIDWESETLACQYNWDGLPGLFLPRKGRVLRFLDAPSVIECVRRNSLYDIIGCATLPLSNQFREELTRGGERNLFVVPIVGADQKLGVFSFHSEKGRAVLEGRQFAIIELFCQMLASVLLRKSQEEELRQLYEDNRLILDATADGIAMISRDGTVLTINQSLADRYGAKREEVTGGNLRDLLPRETYGDLCERRMKEFREVIDTCEPAFFTDVINQRRYHYKVYPIHRKDVAASVVLFSSDITYQIKAIEDEKRAAEYQARLGAMTDFFTNISHEFKTPLSLIINAADLTEWRFRAMAPLEGSDKITKYLGIMRQNANRLLRLIGNLLDLTKADAGFLMNNLQEIEIVSWLQSLVKSVEEYAAQRGIALTLRSEVDAHSMMIDGEKLDRILLNLLSNGIKHTGQGGTIQVTMGLTGDCVRIAVQDDGEGIPLEKQGIIFSRFGQVNTSLTRASEGTGLGLALTRALVEVMRGRIWFVSQPGVGSTFYVEVPVRAERVAVCTGVKEGMSLERKVAMELSDIL